MTAEIKRRKAERYARALKEYQRLDAECSLKDPDKKQKRLWQLRDKAEERMREAFERLAE